MNRIALAALLVPLASCSAPTSPAPAHRHIVQTQQKPWHTGDIPGKMRTTAQNALTTLTALLPTAVSRA
ncbi:hypothetical protein [Amycolatopsis thermoflava]|uniref:Uncharacterized protein n=1 Tax=Amycolatopsis thermoflava TaxID=84480 RepID=A0A3N2H049_9PSEU|nr:hypothetical protein [Amycolatopsis thermoflava]ROS42274.1 hypothetical protein EDD35_4660 [Amycolatopsis thermoflava]